MDFFDHHGLITMKAKLIFIFTPIAGEMIQFDYLDFLNPDTQDLWYILPTFAWINFQLLLWFCWILLITIGKPTMDGIFKIYLKFIYMYLNCVGKYATHLLIFVYSPWVDPTVEDG